MKKRSLWLVVSVGLAMAFAACITVNIYFPAPEVRAAAEEIVDETWGATDVAPAPTHAAPGEQGFLWRLVPGPAVAWAGEGQPDINVSTAAIRTLKAAMKTRSSQLKPYLARGSLGISENGMLVVRDLSGVPLREQASVRRLVDAENRDRRSLYAEIARANQFGPERIDDIAKIFAETWIAKAGPGWWVQQLDGTWKKR